MERQIEQLAILTLVLHGERCAMAAEDFPQQPACNHAARRCVAEALRRK
jgi:hypothetical protein